MLLPISLALLVFLAIFSLLTCFLSVSTAVYTEESRIQSSVSHPVGYIIAEGGNLVNRTSHLAHREKTRRANDRALSHRQSGNRWYISGYPYYPGCLSWEAHQKCPY